MRCERTEYVPEEARQQGAVLARHWGMREYALLVSAAALLLLAIRAIAHHFRKKRDQELREAGLL